MSLSSLGSMIAMIILISMLILVHELGHFLSAKAFGIAVPKFGFGLPIGPTLFKKKFGETEILIHAFLLGGYVSFLDDEEHPEIPQDSPLRFQNKKIWQRAIVVSAGVIANVVTAVILVIIAAFMMQSLPTRESEVTVSKIVAPQNAPIYKTGLQAGDLLYSINGTRITDVTFVSKYAHGARQFSGTVTEERVNKKIEELKKLNPSLDENIKIAKGTKVVLPTFDNEEPLQYTNEYLIGLTNKNKIAKIVKLDSKQTSLRDEMFNKKVYEISKDEIFVKDIATAVSDTISPLNIQVKRNGQLIDLKPLFVDSTGVIGIEQQVKPLRASTKSFKSLITESVKYLCSSTFLMILGLVNLFIGNVPADNLHGIIVITKLGADVIAQSGIAQGFLLTAIISLNLAIINILPIPALDGGHLLFLIIEKLRGKSVSEKVLEKISTICFTLLIILMCYVIYNDIYALITKKFG